MPDGTFDGAASLDVLLFVPDKAKALREVARVLKPNACFAGTTFKLGSPSAALAAPAFVDYPGAFTAAGFAIEVYGEFAGWRKLLEDVTAHILEREQDISREINPQALSRVLKMGANQATRTGRQPTRKVLRSQAALSVIERHVAFNPHFQSTSPPETSRGLLTVGPIALSRSARANALACSSACSRVAEISRSAIITAGEELMTITKQDIDAVLTRLTEASRGRSCWQSISRIGR